MRSIAAAYPHARLERVRGGDTQYICQVNSICTMNAISARLSGMPGLTVVRVDRSPSYFVARLKGSWLWLSLGVALAALFLVSVMVPHSPLEDLSTFQQILIHVAVSVAIAAWVYRHGKKDVQYIIRMASSAEIKAGEAARRARAPA